jgi:hypothetical protein
VTDPTLEEVLQEVLDIRLADVHTALPGKVIRYDAAKQVADVQPMVRSASETAEGAVTVRSYPALVSVPVAFLSGGGFHLSLPLAVGDTGLLVFSELPIDRWRASGQESHPADVRRHHVTSAVFFPGLAPRARAFTDPNLSADAIFGKTGGAVVHLKPNGEVHLGAASASNFVALANLVDARITQLRSDITSLKSAIVAGFNAVVIPAGGGTGATGASTFTSSASAIPAAAATVAASKVKAT